MATTPRNLSNPKKLQALQNKLKKWMDDRKAGDADNDDFRHCCEALEFNSNIQAQLHYILGLIIFKELDKQPVVKDSTSKTSGDNETSSNQLKHFVGRHGQRFSRHNNERERLFLLELEDEIYDVLREVDQHQNNLEAANKALISVTQRTQEEKQSADMEIKEMADKLILLESGLSSIKFRENPHPLITNANEAIHLIEPSDQVDRERTDPDTKEKFIPDKSVSDQYTQCGNQANGLTGSPTTCYDSLKEQHLIERFHELNEVDRRGAMRCLLSSAANNVDNQKLLFTIVQESFLSAKFAFTRYKAKVRSVMLTRPRSDARSLEKAVKEFIARNQDDHCLSSIISEVLRSVRGQRPLLNSYSIQPFVQEVCQLAWNMQSLPLTMDILNTESAAMFDAARYNRHINSNCNSLVIDYYVWPCLVQDSTVLAKGTAVTH